eukprot:3855820-Rhodomonas_salina.1
MEDGAASASLEYFEGGDIMNNNVTYYNNSSDDEGEMEVEFCEKREREKRQRDLEKMKAIQEKQRIAAEEKARKDKEELERKEETLLSISKEELVKKQIAFEESQLKMIEQMDEMMLCPVCCCKFSDENNRPFSLRSCDHPICEGCFNDIMGRDMRRKCPECAVQFAPNSRWIIEDDLYKEFVADVERRAADAAAATAAAASSATDTSAAPAAALAASEEQEAMIAEWDYSGNALVDRRMME